MGRLTIPTLPKFETRLPSNGKKVEFRPITVREESFLLQVKDAKDPEEIFSMLMNITDECILTKGVATAKMPLIDIEWMFLQIRMRSVSEEVDLAYRCKNIVNDKECNGLIETYVDLKDVVIKGTPKIEVSFDFTSGHYNLVFAQPPIKLSSYNSDFDYVWNLLETIEDPNGGLLTKNDLEKSELEEFLGTFTQPQIDHLKSRLGDICSLYYNHTIVCPSCGNETEIEYKNLIDFFI